ncbi:DotD/TraH family lipoprotein [Escherichia coli]
MRGLPARQYGAASEVAVTRHAQYQLWEQGTYSAALPSRQPGGSLQAHSGRVSFDWEGDALELLSELARLRGQQFSYSGVRLPLPVSLHVRDMTFADALRLTEAQTAWPVRYYPGEDDSRSDREWQLPLQG